MIVYDLACNSGHRFEGWFASSAAFAQQQARSLVACPHCGNTAVEKAPMAPAVSPKGNSRREPEVRSAARTIPPAMAEAMKVLAQIQAKALENSSCVGDGFADASRAMHYGEREVETVHGRATRAEAAALMEEGIPIAPLLFPVATPDEIN